MRKTMTTMMMVMMMMMIMMMILMVMMMMIRHALNMSNCYNTVISERDTAINERSSPLPRDSSLPRGHASRKAT